MRNIAWSLVLLAASCVHGTTHVDGGSAPARITPEVARTKLAAISGNRVQLWVVVHVRAHKTLKADGSVDEEKLLADALANVDAVVEGGGDLAMLINSRCDMPLYERVLEAVRARHPAFPLGISALSYGPSNLSEGLRLARRFNARVVWTETVPGERMEYEDDDGKYVPAEVIDPAWALSLHAREAPGVMHVSGVHMKYTRPLDGRSFPEAVRAALGTVDGINVTGPQTGVPAAAEHVEVARDHAGGFPIGVASGVSVDNAADIVNLVDYAIVGTSLKEPGNPLRTSAERVRALRLRLDELGGGKGHAR